MFLSPVGQKAEVTDTHEAFGQDMEEEAADEFLSMEGQGLFSVLVFAIPISEGDLAVFEFEDAVIGERHTVSVAAEVIEDLLWGGERFFRIDDPLCVA